MIIEGRVCDRCGGTRRYAKIGKCVACHQRRGSEWRRANLERMRPRYAALKRKWYANNRERTNANQRASYARLAEKKRAWRAQYVLLHRAEIAAYIKEHAAYYAYYASFRRKLMKAATPPWADREAIKAYFYDADWQTKRNGEQHSVDHIIPVNNRTVCGLNIATNLRVITKSANSQKKNTFDRHAAETALMQELCDAGLTL